MKLPDGAVWRTTISLQPLERSTKPSYHGEYRCRFDSKQELSLIDCSKSMTVALSKGDVTAARAAYHQMSDQGKSAAMTQYLMYKLALQEYDTELGKYLSSCRGSTQLTLLAMKSLEGVLKSSSKDTEKYLYACALEAQQMGDRKQFIATLNKILELHEKNSLNDVRLAVLLRCVGQNPT